MSSVVSVRGREQLVPHEKAVVNAISCLAKGDLRDETALVSLTSDLVSAIKNLSSTATKLIEMVAPQHNGTITITIILMIRMLMIIIMIINEREREKRDDVQNHLRFFIAALPQFIQQRDKLHEGIRAIVSNIRDGNNSSCSFGLAFSFFFFLFSFFFFFFLLFFPAIVNGRPF